WVWFAGFSPVKLFSGHRALSLGRRSFSSSSSPAFVFPRDGCFFAFSSLFRLCPIETFCTSLAQLTLESHKSRRNRWVRWSQFPACSVETIGGFVFAGDVFSVPVAVV
ncbi:unnamed protein product, partial [Brassica oleracea var. botrytis]